MTRRESIKEVLIRRDGMDPSDAEDLINEAREELLSFMDEGNFSYEDAAQVVEDYFGLEPDYLDDLIF